MDNFFVLLLEQGIEEQLNEMIDLRQNEVYLKYFLISDTLMKQITCTTRDSI